jgi:hypothetical protein
MADTAAIDFFVVPTVTCEVEPAENGGVVSLPRVGELHHQYTRAA